MPTRISLRRVEEPPRASSWPYPVRWPNFSRMRRRLENAPLLVGLKPRSKCSNQSFGRGASSYLCAVPRPTDQPLTTLSASKHDRPTDQRAVVGDFGWQLSKNPRRRPARRGGVTRGFLRHGCFALLKVQVSLSCETEATGFEAIACPQQPPPRARRSQAGAVRECVRAHHRRLKSKLDSEVRAHPGFLRCASAESAGAHVKLRP